MLQDQFERESNFQLAYSIFKKMHSEGLLTEKQLANARKKLVERFCPPIASLPDILSKLPG